MRLRNNCWPMQLTRPAAANDARSALQAAPLLRPLLTRADRPEIEGVRFGWPRLAIQLQRNMRVRFFVVLEAWKSLSAASSSDQIWHRTARFAT